MPLPITNLYIQDGLQRPEFFWRTHYDWFKSQGYQIRPRFAPDWVPSWKGTNKDETECEDGLMLFVCLLLKRFDTFRHLKWAKTFSESPNQ